MPRQARAGPHCKLIKLAERRRYAAVVLDKHSDSTEPKYVLRFEHIIVQRVVCSFV